MSDCWNPCHECGAYQLKALTAESKIELDTEYLVYNEPYGEWDIAQFNGETWESTVGPLGSLYPVTHYQELPTKP